MQEVSAKRETQPLHEWVYHAICENILAGKFVPGVSVTLRGLAENLNVSPMPVREAIRRLVAEGALEVLANRRVCVSYMSKTRLSDLNYARLSMEPELAQRAFDNIDKNKIKELQKIDQEINESLLSGNVDTYIICNRRFHFDIYERADSPVLFPLVKSLWLQYAPYTRIVFGRVGTEVLKDYHAVALTAIKRGDQAGFRQAIKSDISEGMDMIAEQFERDQVVKK